MKPGYLSDSDEFLTVEDALGVISLWTDLPFMRRSRLPNKNSDDIRPPRFTRDQNEQALREAYEDGTLTLQDEESMRAGKPSKHLESTRKRVMAKINSSPLTLIAATLWISLTDFNRFAKLRFTSFSREELVAHEIWLCDVENELGYTIRGAARALAKKYSISERAMAQRIFDAAEQGKVQVRDPQTGIAYVPKDPTDHHERISVSDLNQWLEESGVPYRLGEDSVASTSATTVTGRQDINRSMVMQIFAVRAKEDENRKFWDDKLGRPPDWLRGARTFSGKPGFSSRWNPLLVAHALLNGKYMSVRQLDSAIHQHLPELLEKWKEDTDDHHR